jgi:cellulose synthase/poly-beta-1,6-N-acetylglucosamine synthase-like glycosyltransferase
MDILTKVGLFPTETSAEDLPLGFYLCLNNYPLRPLPVLENVENPDSLSMLLTQKSVWFWGMVDYLEYANFSKKKVRKYDLVRTYIMALKGLKRDAAAWLLTSPSILFVITSTFFLDGYLKMYPIVGLLIYAFFPSAIIEFLQRTILYGKTQALKHRKNMSFGVGTAAGWPV